MSHPLLRVARPTDIPKLAILMAESMRGLGSDFYSPEQLEWAATYLTVPDPIIIGDQTYAVIEIDGQLAAGGGWSRRRKLFTGSPAQESKQEFLDPATEPAKIRAFFVHPMFARQGLARTLFEWCQIQAYKAGFRRLELMATLPGVPLYTALGFMSEGRSDIILPNGSGLPCLKMSRKIDIAPHFGAISN